MASPLLRDFRVSQIDFSDIEVARCYFYADMKWIKHVITTAAVPRAIASAVEATVSEKLLLRGWVHRILPQSSCVLCALAIVRRAVSRSSRIAAGIISMSPRIAVGRKGPTIMRQDDGEMLFLLGQ